MLPESRLGSRGGGNAGQIHEANSRLSCKSAHSLVTGDPASRYRIAAGIPGPDLPELPQAP